MWQSKRHVLDHVENESQVFPQQWIVLHLQMKTYLNTVVWKTKYGHALDAVGKLGQDDQSHSENPWLWYNLCHKSHMSDKSQDPRIHTGVLAGHHDHNSGIHTLPYYRIRVGTCAVQSGACHRCRLRCSLQWIGCSDLVSCSNLGNTGAAETRTKNMYDMKDMSPCPKHWNKQITEKQNRLFWSVCPSTGNS